ncbi:hypothetical protein GCM10025868_11350 [Angustibacter aerolatus]|uniref:Uncharacterized protein n=1 Tax=Angustibacter aerolatus TaxID=1162965 RepID=A0ABQ6JGC5_9ACTN|nr:hypothetical protein GCM10025868_11350 [Angustibacter aerolatus]
MLADARERYDVPVVEVIRPAVRRAAAASRTGHVGVICTQATRTSGAYEDAFAAAPHLRVTTRACPRFVEFVESGVTSGPEPARRRARVPRPGGRGRRRHAGARLHALPAAHRRDLVRRRRPGHPGHSAEETAKDVYRRLVEHDLLRDPALPAPVHRFETTGDPTRFADLGRRFLGPEVSAASLVGA